MEHTTATQVSVRVSQEIKTSGVTVVWLCEKTGIPRTTMSRRLAGHTPFDLNELDRIAEALRIPVATFLSVVAA